MISVVIGIAFHQGSQNAVIRGDLRREYRRNQLDAFGFLLPCGRNRDIVHLPRNVFHLADGLLGKGALMV